MSASPPCSRRQADQLDFPCAAGGGGYFTAPSYPQAAWQGAQYGGQYGMNPAAASMQAAMQAGGSGQQGMPGGAGGMGGGPGGSQQGGPGGPYGGAASGGPKPTPTVTPPRVSGCPHLQWARPDPVRRLPCQCCWRLFRADQPRVFLSGLSRSEGRSFGQWSSRRRHAT